MKSALMDNFLRPLEGHGVLVARRRELVDGGTHLFRVCGAQVLQDGSSEDAKPDFNLVQPGRMGGCVVEVDERMLLQPSVMLGLVGAYTVSM